MRLTVTASLLATCLILSAGCASREPGGTTRPRARRSRAGNRVVGRTNSAP